MIRVALLLITLFAVAGSGVLAQEPTPSATSGTTLNLNSATLPQLEALPGVGRSTAERIIEYRQKNGGFKRIEDLMNVRGIGEKNFLKLKPLITVAPPRGERTAAQP
jgi:competence protein ComEA